MSKKTFSEALREARAAAGVTLQALADAVKAEGVKLNAPNITEVEKGRRSGFARDTVAAIERALGLPKGDLARHLPPEHAARQLAETEVPDYGLVWGSPPRDVPEPEDGKTYRLTGRWPAGTFVLRVSGHSVHGYGVHDGDVIAVRPTVHPEDGALVVARQGNAYTLKGCVGGKLKGFGKDDGEEREVDGREAYQVVGVMLGIVDGPRRYAQKPKLRAAPPGGKPKK